MGVNKNLETAQKLFSELTQGRVSEFDTGRSISLIRSNFEKARRHGSMTSLDVSVLDATGRKNSEEVEEAIRRAEQDAAFRKGIRHARLMVDNLQAAPATRGNRWDETLNAIHDTLNDIGIKTEILKDDYSATLANIQALLKKHEEELAEKRTAASKVAMSR